MRRVRAGSVVYVGDVNFEPPTVRLITTLVTDVLSPSVVAAK